jgi:hypothetical protein
MFKKAKKTLKKIGPINRSLGFHSFFIGIPMIVSSAIIMTKDIENDIEYKNFVTGLMIVNMLSFCSILLNNRKKFFFTAKNPEIFAAFSLFYLAFSALIITKINKDEIEDIKLLKIVTVSQTVVTIFNIIIYYFIEHSKFY